MADSSEPEGTASVPPTDAPGDSVMHGLNALVEFTGALASEHDIHHILFVVVARLARLLGVDRGSIVLVDDEQHATVVATSDDAQLRSLTLTLDRYPELRHVLDTAETMVIEQLASSPLFTEILRDSGPIDFASMALVPIVGERGTLGVLCLRGRNPTSFSSRGLLEARAVANATAIALNNAAIVRTLSSESQRHVRRLRELSRYLDFFESSADAMLVMDRRGVILFANPTAVRLTGLGEETLVGLHFDQLVDKAARRLAQEVVHGFAEGHYPVGIDFALDPGSSQLRRVASVNFSLVVRENDAVLATMRDVTRERAMRRELAQTKEYLERVIDSSVDSIVASDLHGNVLLFNRAASRLFGYEQGEVRGHLNVEQLYPPGVARDIMRMIRSSEHGGRGRLEDFRVDMLTKSGELLPVTLSAAFVMADQRPVGTLGIFTDIREKLAMEVRLSEAQAELRQHERTAAIVELAGAAAHELNQPLTSVMGYAEYLRRALSGDPQLERAISVIQTETERMAEIVRKVGRVTHYETKPYVGDSKIVDLDRASREDPTAVPPDVEET